MQSSINFPCVLLFLIIVLVLSAVRRMNEEPRDLPVLRLRKRAHRRDGVPRTAASPAEGSDSRKAAARADAGEASGAPAAAQTRRAEDQAPAPEGDAPAAAASDPEPAAAPPEGDAARAPPPAPAAPKGPEKAPDAAAEPVKLKKGEWGNLTCAQLAKSRPDLKVIVGQEPARRHGLVVKFAGEFGYEMGLFLPYCHYLHTRGLLRATISVHGTAPFYWFSPCHVENKNAKRKNTGYMEVHEKYWNPRKWNPPSYKLFKEPAIFNFAKPIVFVHNKYSQEWHDGKNKFGPPVNYIKVDVLRCIFQALTPNYTVIYSRPRSGDFVGDDQGIGDLQDYQLIADNFSASVLTFADLVKRANGTQYDTYNSLQLHIHANTQRFISVQGGSSYISSLFGGTNIIYHRKYGGEWSHKIQPYTRLFPRLSRARILPVKRFGTLLRRIREQYLRDVALEDLPPCMPRREDEREAAAGAAPAEKAEG